LPEALPVEAIPADPEVAEVTRVLVRFEVPVRSDALQ